ncbi:hypothetical protein KHA80_10380 [Anaerobacillus sp. HL2]|nr:hypothetical protein KHA80_10380 [Anaerobacillus sp. HL2]
MEGDPLIAKIERDGEFITEIDLNAVKETQYINFEEGIEVTIEIQPGKSPFYEI